MSPLAHDDDEDDDCKNSKYLRQSQGTPDRYRIWTCGYRLSFMTIIMHGGLDDDHHHDERDGDHHHGDGDDSDDGEHNMFPLVFLIILKGIYLKHILEIIPFEDNEENQWKLF